MQTRFQIGDTVVTNKFLFITDSNCHLRPEEPGIVVEVDDDDGGLLVRFDGHPNGVGVFPGDVVAR
jgi:hypothetical protein